MGLGTVPPDQKEAEEPIPTDSSAVMAPEGDDKNANQSKGVFPEESGSTSRIWNSLRVKIAIFLLSFGIFLALWQGLATLTNNSLILSAPVPVFQALIRLLQNNLPRAAEGLQSPSTAIIQTIEIIFLGFGLSALVGIPIGILEGRWSFAEDIIDPWINATYSIPIVALIPTLYFAIGGSFFAFVFIAFLLSVFSIIVNTQNGVKYTVGSLADVGRSFRASEIQFITKIVLPSSLADIITGLRIGLGRAILGAILAQVLLSGNGLGGMMTTFQDLYDTPYTMATILIIAVLGIVLLQLPKLLENRFITWRPSDQISGDTAN
jgi:ABC-type nitrate/sulfonate/bicarbonate transport system permease component